MARRGAFRNRLEWALVRFVLASLRLGSRRFAFQLARFYVSLLDAFVPKLRRVAGRNLDLVAPELNRDRMIGESFDSIARLFVCISRLRRTTDFREWIRYDGLEHFQQAKSKGKGVLFATAHLGNWELSALAHGAMTEPMHVVVRALDNPLLDREATRLRMLTGNKVIEKRDFARGILRALAANEAVGVLIDQNVAADEGIFVPFFGVPACVSTGLARIAAHSGAAIIPGFALWSEPESKYVLKFWPAFWATGDVEADTRRVQGELERAIRAYPGQWLWMHRRWKTRPAGEPGFYD